MTFRKYMKASILLSGIDLFYNEYDFIYNVILIFLSQLYLLPLVK